MRYLLPQNISNNVSPPLGGRWAQREDRAGASLSLEVGREDGEGVGLLEQNTVMGMRRYQIQSTFYVLLDGGERKETVHTFKSMKVGITH